MRTLSALSVPRLYAGQGYASRIRSFVAGMCARNSMIILATDRNIVRTGAPDLIVGSLRDAGFAVNQIDTIPAEPSDQELDTLAQTVRDANATMIIAVGGGSVMDAAKILSVLAIHRTTTANLAEGGVPGPGLPCIMLPTTAGTGAEATPNAIVLFPERNLKIGIVSHFLVPEVVVLDPDLVLGLPPGLTASTGIDAMCHLLECFLGRKANPFSDMYALEGLRLMSKALPRAYADPQDIEARFDTLLGAYFGGVCIASSGTNAIHALSYPLGGTFRIPHGVANAILLVPVMEYQRTRIAQRLAKVAGAIGSPVSGDDQTDALSVVERLRSLVETLGIPAGFSEFGVPASSIRDLVAAAHGVRRLLDNNPVVLDERDIETIYRSVI